MFLILLVLIVILACIFSNEKYSNGKKYFIIGSAILLILYASLRGININSDVKGYLSQYAKFSKYSFNEILEIFKSDIKYPLFYLLGWFVSRVFPSGQVWLAFLSVLYIIAFMFLIYKESKMPLISVVVFLSLGYFTFSLTGLRQALAMTLIVPAYYFAKNSKIIKFILVVLLAYLFHNSALIFLLIYPMRNLKLGWFHALFIGICLAFSFIFKSEFKALIGVVFEDSYYGGYSESNKTLNFSGIIIQLAIFVFNLFYYKNVTNKSKRVMILYNCAFLGLSFQLLSIVIAEMFRISMYFSIFNIVLIPLSIMAEPDQKWCKVEMILITVVLLAYLFVSGIPQYSFFWQ